MNTKILEDIERERKRQDDKWGANQTHPDVHPDSEDGDDACVFAGVMSESSAKIICQDDAEDGNTNWASILTEEVSEAINAAGNSDLVHAREEAVQVAAVAAAWIEDIDRRIV